MTENIKIKFDLNFYFMRKLHKYLIIFANSTLTFERKEGQKHFYSPAEKESP